MKTIDYLIFSVAFIIFSVSTLGENTITDITGRSASGILVGFRENQILFVQSNQRDTQQYYKSEIINPCEDPIFQTIREKKLEELSEREFEYYKIKSKECDDYKNRLVLKGGQEEQKKQSEERNYLLWLLVLVIWIPYYLSTW